MGINRYIKDSISFDDSSVIIFIIDKVCRLQNMHKKKTFSKQKKDLKRRFFHRYFSLRTCFGSVMICSRIGFLVRGKVQLLLSMKKAWAMFVIRSAPEVFLVMYKLLWNVMLNTLSVTQFDPVSISKHLFYIWYNI